MYRRLAGSRDRRRAPFLAPALMIVAAAVLAAATRALGNRCVGRVGATTSSFFGGLNNTADEDSSAFGPVGGWRSWVSRSSRPLAPVRQSLEELLSPVELCRFLLALSAKFNPNLPRFLVLPAVLTAPLLAHLFRRRATAVAYAAVALLVIGLGVTRQEHKRLFSTFGRPWNLTQVEALAESGPKPAAAALALFDAAVLPHATVGAVLADGDRPTSSAGRTSPVESSTSPREAPQAARSRRPLRRGGRSTRNARRQRTEAAGWTIPPLPDTGSAQAPLPQKHGVTPPAPCKCMNAGTGRRTDGV